MHPPGNATRCTSDGLERNVLHVVSHVDARNVTHALGVQRAKPAVAVSSRIHAFDQRCERGTGVGFPDEPEDERWSGFNRVEQVSDGRCDRVAGDVEVVKNDKTGP
jgi:hypothetical protein